MGRFNESALRERNAGDAAVRQIDLAEVAEAGKVQRLDELREAAEVNDLELRACADGHAAGLSRHAGVLISGLRRTENELFQLPGAADIRELRVDSGQGTDGLDSGGRVDVGFQVVQAGPCRHRDRVGLSGLRSDGDLSGVAVLHPEVDVLVRHDADDVAVGLHAFPFLRRVQTQADPVSGRHGAAVLGRAVGPLILLELCELVLLGAEHLRHVSLFAGALVGAEILPEHVLGH